MNLNNIRDLVDQAMLSQVLWASATDLPSMSTSRLMMMFKWPDVVRSMMDLMDGKEVEEVLLKDLHDVVIYPLASIGRGYVEYIRHKEIGVPPEIDLDNIEQTIVKLLHSGETVTASNTSEKARAIVAVINVLSTLSKDLNTIKEFNNEN